MTATELVLWGYKPSYADAPIKLTGGTRAECAAAQRSREAEGGWLLAVYPAGEAPGGLRAQVADLAAGRCPWMFHGVSRRERGDGTVTLALEGHRYPTGAERRGGAGSIRAAAPCATRTVPARFENWGVDGGRVQVYESDTAAAMTREHCGDPYTVVWHGRGWTVEIRSDYPLWRVTC